MWYPALNSLTEKDNNGEKMVKYKIKPVVNTC